MAADRPDETPTSFDSDLTTSRLFVPVISISESLSDTLARFFPFLLEDVDADVGGAGDSRGVGLSDSDIWEEGERAFRLPLEEADVVLRVLGGSALDFAVGFLGGKMGMGVGVRTGSSGSTNWDGRGDDSIGGGVCALWSLYSGETGVGSRWGGVGDRGTWLSRSWCGSFTAKCAGGTAGDGERRGEMMTEVVSTSIDVSRAG